MKHTLAILNIILITAFLFLGVKGFYNFLASKLNPVRPPEVGESRTVSQEEGKKIRPLSHYKAIAERNLFRTKDEAEKKPEPEPEPEPEAPKETDLKLKLWGTVTGAGDRNYAVIQEEKKRKQNLFTVGDNVEGATIKEIFREKIILSVNGKDEILKLEERRTGSRSRRSAQRKTKRATPKGGNTKLSVNRAEIEEAMSDLNGLLKQARIRPHFKNGQADGISLTRVRRKSVFRKLGLRSGDIITGVDGEDIRSVDDALKFYDSLRSASDVKLDIRRRGRKKSIEYNIK